MDDEIKNEQMKLAKHLRNLSPETRQTQGLLLMAYLQGFEIGYQTAKSEKEDRK